MSRCSCCARPSRRSIERPAPFARSRGIAVRLSDETSRPAQSSREWCSEAEALPHPPFLILLAGNLTNTGKTDVGKGAEQAVNSRDEAGKSRQKPCNYAVAQIFFIAVNISNSIVADVAKINSSLANPDQKLQRDGRTTGRRVEMTSAVQNGYSNAAAFAYQSSNDDRKSSETKKGAGQSDRIRRQGRRYG